MQQLSPLDASFVYAETARTPMHIGSVAVYDPSTAPNGFVRFKDILSFIEGGLPGARAFRQRLIRVPLDLDHPYWIEDPEFDLEFHVRHMAFQARGRPPAGHPPARCTPGRWIGPAPLGVERRGGARRHRGCPAVSPDSEGSTCGRRRVSGVEMSTRSTIWSRIPRPLRPSMAGSGEHAPRRRTADAEPTLVALIQPTTVKRDPEPLGARHASRGWASSLRKGKVVCRAVGRSYGYPSERQGWARTGVERCDASLGNETRDGPGRRPGGVTVNDAGALDRRRLPKGLALRAGRSSPSQSLVAMAPIFAANGGREGTVGNRVSRRVRRTCESS